MSALVEVDFNGEQFILSSRELLQSLVRRLKTLSHSTLFLKATNGQMILEYVEDIGFSISAFGCGEIEEWLALDDRQSPDWVKVDISGHVDDVPRNILVADEIALAIASEFYSTGQRSGDFSWVRSVDLMKQESSE